ncbi:hypothetical protein TWF281_008572 [Arthrobotrys megalospora]
MEFQSSTTSTPSKASTASTPKSKPIRPTGLQAIHNYHGLGPKKLGTFHSLHSLKRYTETELRKLQREFEVEINQIKSSGIPLAKEITFSNIDQYIIDAVAGLEGEKQTLTHLRGVIAMHGRTIVQIAEDLREEIQLVIASGNHVVSGKKEEE